MSKSLGNVVRPLDLIEQHGVDAVRYYLMSEMVLGADASFTPENFIKRYNSDLANDFGNLLNRVSGLISKNHGGMVPEPGILTPADEDVASFGRALGGKVQAKISDYRVDEAINEIMNLIRQVNKYMETQAPWKLVKTDVQAAGRVLYVASESLRLSAVLLKAVMPAKALEVLKVLGAQDSGLSWGELKPGAPLASHGALFPRIEAEKKL